MLEAFFESMLSDASIKPLALEDLRRSKKGNDYLYADADLTSINTNGNAVEVSGVDADAIHAAIEAYAVGKKNGEARDKQALSGVYVIRTPRARFPNGLFYWMDKTESGFRVSLFSRSVFGRRDFGVNEAYVKSVAKRLGEL